MATRGKNFVRRNASIRKRGIVGLMPSGSEVNSNTKRHSERTNQKERRTQNTTNTTQSPGTCCKQDLDDCLGGFAHCHTLVCRYGNGKYGSKWWREEDDCGRLARKRHLETHDFYLITSCT